MLCYIVIRSVYVHPPNWAMIILPAVSIAVGILLCGMAVSDLLEDLHVLRVQNQAGDMPSLDGNMAPHTLDAARAPQQDLTPAEKLD
jgi:hypothetical protein